MSPYIIKSERPKFDGAIDTIVRELENEGQLNYVITKILHGLVEKRGEKYALYNTLIGTLESVKLEFYRREVAPYEDEKIKINGDIK